MACRSSILESPQMNSMTSGVLPAHNEAVVFRTVADGAVLLHTEREVYYGLNPVGARIWELLPESDDLDQLCVRLGETYPDATSEQLREDVTELLDMLRGNGLVVDRGGSATES